MACNTAFATKRAARNQGKKLRSFVCRMDNWRDASITVSIHDDEQVNQHNIPRSQTHITEVERARVIENRHVKRAKGDPVSHIRLKQLTNDELDKIEKDGQELVLWIPTWLATAEGIDVD